MSNKIYSKQFYSGHFFMESRVGRGNVWRDWQYTKSVFYEPLFSCSQEIRVYGGVVKDGVEYVFGGNEYFTRSSDAQAYFGVNSSSFCLFQNFDDFIFSNFTPHDGYLSFRRSPLDVVNDELFCEIIAGIKNTLDVSFVFSIKPDNLFCALSAINAHSASVVSGKITSSGNSKEREKYIKSIAKSDLVVAADVFGSGIFWGGEFEKEIFDLAAYVDRTHSKRVSDMKSGDYFDVKKNIFIREYELNFFGKKENDLAGVLREVSQHKVFRGVEVGSVCSRGEHGFTPLHVASLLGDVFSVRVLLDGGADINATTDGGGTPLHFAIFSESLNVIGLLLDRGARKDFKNEMGMTPGEYANFLGFKKLAKEILK